MPGYDITRYATVAEFIQSRQSEIGITDKLLAMALGHGKEKIVRTIKSGVQRLPLTSVLDLAEILNVDPAELLRLTLSESDPSVLSVIESIAGPIKTKINAGELMATLAAMGEATDRRDPDPVYTGRTVMELAKAGLIRLPVSEAEDEDAADIPSGTDLRMPANGGIPVAVAMLDQLGDPLRVSTNEARIVHAYRAACNGSPGTATLTSPGAIVLVVPQPAE